MDFAKYNKNYAKKEVTEGGGYRPSQPSQRFPFRAITPPRVDNKNQPWYATDQHARSFGRGPDTIQDHDAIVQDSRLSSPTQNMKAIWHTFNTFHGGQDAKSNLMDRSQVVGPSMGDDNE